MIGSKSSVRCESARALFPPVLTPSFDQALRHLVRSSAWASLELCEGTGQWDFNLELLEATHSYKLFSGVFDSPMTGHPRGELRQKIAPCLWRTMDPSKLVCSCFEKFFSSLACLVVPA
jgi:hypothetical protein